MSELFRKHCANTIILFIVISKVSLLAQKPSESFFLKHPNGF